MSPGHQITGGAPGRRRLGFPVPARHNRSAPIYPARLVAMPAGGTAHADLFWSDGEVFTSGCKPTTASLVKVFPPNSRTSKQGFFDLQVCTLARHPYLRKRHPLRPDGRRVS